MPPRAALRVAEPREERRGEVAVAHPAERDFDLVVVDLLLQVAHPPRAQDGEQQARLARRDQQRQPGGGERKILKLGAA